jgi:kinetochore protein Fta7
MATDRRQKRSRSSKSGRAPRNSDSSASRPVKRRHHSSANSTTHDSGTHFRDFVRLTPRVHQIRQSTISSKWLPLSTTAQQHARDTLKIAKRAVVMSHWDERRRAEADVAINVALKKVEKRLPRMPFPPKTKETWFDYDKLAENTVGCAPTSRCDKDGLTNDSDFLKAN